VGNSPEPDRLIAPEVSTQAAETAGDIAPQGDWSPGARRRLAGAVLIGGAAFVFGLVTTLAPFVSFALTEILKPVLGITLVALGGLVSLWSFRLLTRAGPDTPYSFGDAKKARAFFVVVWLTGSIIGMMASLTTLADMKPYLVTATTLGLGAAGAGAVWMYRWIGAKLEGRWPVETAGALRRRSSAWSVFFVFVWGILSAALAIGVEIGLIELALPLVKSRVPSLSAITDIASLLQDPIVIVMLAAGVALVAPAVEEIAKACGLRLFRSAIHAPGDGLLLGLMAGLGFGFIESAGYILGSVGSPTILILIWLRVATMLVHSITTGLTGAGYARARLSGERRALWSGLGRAILLHATWNTGVVLILGSGLVGTGGLSFIALIGMVLVAVWVMPKVAMAAVDQSIQEEHAAAGAALPRAWSPIADGVWWRFAGGRPQLPSEEAGPSAESASV
jgi:RsiW-degrading membrane proteinase PrsW (M82 family)